MKLKFFLLFSLILSSSLSFSAAQEASSTAEKELPTEEEKRDEAQEEVERLAVFLDLDECLFHSKESEAPEVQKLKEMSLEFIDTEEEFPYTPFLRPGVREFLAECTKHFDTYVFTASTAPYADRILYELDPEGKLKGRFYRDSCHVETWVNNEGEKEAIHIKNINLSFGIPQGINRRVLVDNSIVSFLSTPRNAIWVSDWKATNPEDRELEKVLALLHKIAKVPDVRDALQAETCDVTKDIAPILELIKKGKNRRPFRAPLPALTAGPSYEEETWDKDIYYEVELERLLKDVDPWVVDPDQEQEL